MRFFAAAVWLVAAVGMARAAAPVYDCPEGGFAFEQPPGWTTAKEKDEAFPTLSGPKADLRAPYVVIHAVKDARDLFTFADAAMKEKLKDFHFQLTRRDAFQTADKDFGVKFVFTFNATGDKPGDAITYKQAYYLVPGPPGYLDAFLATVPEEGWEKYQPVLDDMMKSYHHRPVVAAAKAATSATAPPAEVPSSKPSAH